MNGNVLIAAPVHPVLTEGLAALGYDCIVRESITQAIAYELIKDCVGVITSTRLQLDKGLLGVAPALQWIGRMGSGMEVIDMVYTAEKGISCFASPEGNCNAVGEHALGMLLSLLHRISWSQGELNKGIWLREENRGTELEGKTIGIIGFGYTGSSFAKKLQGFDARILAYDRYNPGGITGSVTKCDSIAPIFDEADIVSFHVPMLDETRHYFNRDFIGRMKKPFVLINTSRGSVVDTEALLDGMDSGKIKGACLDVFEKEPFIRADGVLWERFNERISMRDIIVTPHIAGYTFEALLKMSKVLLEKISCHTTA